MKLWKQRTHRGRKFYRRNHGKLKKDMFYLSYYRILHTAYLQNQTYCLPTVKSMFADTFGHEPDVWSQYYLMDTETCFINDAVLDKLNHQAVFSDLNTLSTLLIEIGFDVYLIKCLKNGERLNRKQFYRWLPIKKNYKLKKTVKAFWKNRLPKEKSFQQLYVLLQPYTTEILTVYRKLLIENDVLLTMTPQRAYVLETINSMLIEQEEINELTEELAVTVNHECKLITPDVDLVCEDNVSFEQNSNCNDYVTTASVCESATVLPVKASSFVMTKPISHSVTTEKTVKKVPKAEAASGHGFSENKTMSTKKAVTCAVCVAAAGALLLPLVAYSVMKQK